MKSIIRFSLFALICADIGTAQEPKQLPLQPISRPTVSGEKRCQPFFAVVRYSEASEGHVIFAYKLPDGSIKGDSVPSSRVVINLVDGVPSYEETTTEDGRIGARFRLSQVEYQKAEACLPKRTVIINTKPQP